MRIGVLGAGQLGRMLGLAGIPLGLSFRFYAPEQHPPAAVVGPCYVGAFTDLTAIERFANGLDVVTYEFENIPSDSVSRLANLVPVYPAVSALEVAQDRLAEKTLFGELGVATPRFAPINSLSDLEKAVEFVGAPAILKTRRLGYDGKGQTALTNVKDAEVAWEKMLGAPAILEERIAFQRELSLLSVRDRQGDFRFYPLVENEHREGILRVSLAPAKVSPELQTKAERHARRIMDRFNYIGVLAIEFFERDGELIANEMAPRVHNSGHWTIEGADVSQFENHVRAISGWTLGSTAPRGYSAMLNLIGDKPDLASVLACEGAHPHDYGKENRPGRKVGHITVTAESRDELRSRLAWLCPRIGFREKSIERFLESGN